MAISRILAILILRCTLLCGCGIRCIDGGAPDSAAAPDTLDSESAVSSDSETIPLESESATEAATTDVSTEAPPVTAPEGDYEGLVFMYHLILEEPYSPYENLFVRPSEFESQLSILKSLGYEFAFAEEYSKHFSRPTAILTFDDGYEDNYTEMFPLLKAAGAKATVFLATSLVGTDGYLTEAQIKEMASSGLVSFQSHTASHIELGALSSELIASEMRRSIEYIEGLTGKKVNSLAYPAGSFGEAAMAAVGEFVDFAYTTQAPSAATVDSALAIPRIRISRGCPDSAFRSYCEY